MAIDTRGKPLAAASRQGQAQIGAYAASRARKRKGAGGRAGRIRGLGIDEYDFHGHRPGADQLRGDSGGSMRASTMLTALGRKRSIALRMRKSSAWGLNIASTRHK